MLSKYYFLLVLFLFVTVTQSDPIRRIMQEFNMNHPLIMGTKLRTNTIKAFSESDQFSKVSHNFTKDMNTFGNWIVFVDNIDILEVAQILTANQKLQMLLVLKKNEELNLISESCSINQHVYFLKVPSNEVFESYHVNGKNIQRKLGHYQLSNDSFVWDSQTEVLFFKRRGNFHGVTLKGVVEDTEREMILDANYFDQAPYDANDMTYFVNGFVQGLFADILQLLENQLNFTTLLYKSKEKDWGFVREFENGSVQVTGMVGEIHAKKVDLVVASLTMTPKRIKYVDFLPPLTTERAGIYIPSWYTKQSFELDIYFKPLELNLWVLIIGLAILIGLLKLAAYNQLPRHYVNKDISATFVLSLNFIWTSFISIFGGKPPGCQLDNQSHYRMIVFISLLYGGIIWMCYRSYLTALLSSSEKKYPFIDLDSLADTNWRY